MQTVSLRAMIEDSPVRPISSMQVCNRIIPVAMAPLPCAGKSPLSPYPEMEEALVLTDAQDQTKYLQYLMIVTDIPTMNLMQARPIPLHFPLRNAGAYDTE